MHNVCNTNSRTLQQSETFIFLGILDLGLHPAPDSVCGVWTYKLPQAYNAGSSLDKSQGSNRVGHKFVPRLLVRLGSQFNFFYLARTC